jgi:cellulose synthase/poly-beta-1,6-N-acetylglucosamine synthase-like glycosyltransferase
MRNSPSAFPPRRLLTLILFLMLITVFIGVFYKAYQSNSLLNGVFFPVQMLLLLMCVYTFLPALTYIFFRKKIDKAFDSSMQAPPQYFESSTDFIILIPAHNEALTLPALLASIKKLVYPTEHLKTLVIADNCSDNTAFTAQNAGSIVFERQTDAPSDKTQALHYAAELLAQMPELSPETMVLVIDADCQLPPNFLLGMAEALAHNPTLQALQSHRFVQNLDASKTSLLDAAAEALRQRVNSGVRHWLGLENYLYGLGTGFRLPLFIEMTQLDQLVFADDKAWKAHLAERKIAIGYAPKAVVAYTACAQEAQFQKQRLRWVTGHYDMIRRFFMPMFTQSAARLNLSQLDFSASIITLPRSFLLLFCLGFGFLSVVFPHFSLFSTWTWLLTVLAYFLYAALGLHIIGSNKYSVLLSGVSLVWGVVEANFKSLIRKGSRAWGVER